MDHIDIGDINDTKKEFIGYYDFNCMKRIKNHNKNPLEKHLSY